MKRLLLASVCLLPIVVVAQSVPTPTKNGLPSGAPAGPGDPLFLQQLMGFFGGKQDANGDITGQHLTATGAVKQRLLSDKAAELLTPSDFVDGAHSELLLRTGQMDAGPVFTLWQAAGGGVLPCGTYRLDETWTTPALSAPVILGRGQSCVTIKTNPNFVAGDIIAFNNPVLGRVSDFTIQAGALRTSGTALHYILGFVNNLDRVSFTGPHGGDALLMDGSNSLYADHLQCKTPAPNGSFAVGQFFAGACVHLTNGVVEGHVTNSVSNNWHFGEEVTSTQGATFAFNDWIASGNGIMYDPSKAHGDTVWGVASSHEYSDTSLADNWYFGGDGQISDVQADDPWASNSQSANGFGFNNASIDGIQLSGADILANYGEGIAALLGTNIQFSIPQIMMNSQIGSGQRPGVFVGAGIGSFTLEGGTCGRGGHLYLAGQVNNQSYCVVQQSSATAPQYLTIMGLHTIGHVSGSLSLQPVSGNYASTVNLGNTGN